MNSASVPLALRGRLGDGGAAALEELLTNGHREVRDEVLTLAEARFERRLAEELGTLRVALAGEMATLRRDLQTEIATSRVELLKWSFLFWIGQVIAIAGLMTVMFRLLGS
jgi:hypothetical protein